MLEGGYDLHIHRAPSHFQRLFDDVELLKEAATAAMAGIMIKNHYESPSARAALLNKHSNSSTIAYGGIVLNWPVGGLNPYAVESALKLGARFVWLPTRDAANCLIHGLIPRGGFDRKHRFNENEF